MRNLKKMSVNKAITILFMSLVISLGHSQEKTRFFELKKTDEYEYKISKNKKEIILFSNTEDSQNSFSISFNVEKTILAKCCTIKSENYNWLLKNLLLKYKKEGENIIELNNFEGLIIYKREGSNCHAYKVKSRNFMVECLVETVN